MSSALTLPLVAACGPAQGQGGIGAGGGDSVQEGAGVQRRAAPAGPGQDVPVQPHRSVQGLPHLLQQLQRGSHGGQAVPGHGAGSQEGSVTAVSPRLPCQVSTCGHLLTSPVGMKPPDSQPCSQHFLASPHNPQPCPLFISGMRRALTQEDTLVSNIRV